MPKAQKVSTEPAIENILVTALAQTDSKTILELIYYAQDKGFLETMRQIAAQRDKEQNEKMLLSA